VFCTGASISGEQRAKYPQKISETIVIDTEAGTVNGKKSEGHYQLEVSEVRLHFIYTSNNINAFFAIDRTTGRFIFGQSVTAIYEGTCRKAIQAKQF
jgi:hypothetical protein